MALFPPSCCSSGDRRVNERCRLPSPVTVVSRRFAKGYALILLRAFALLNMPQCPDCGCDLPSFQNLCSKCYDAQYTALTVPKDSSIYSWSAFMAVLLWIFICYAFLTYMPAFARAVALGVVLVGIWCLFFWAQSQRPRKRYGTPLQHFSFILGVCCGVVWKITGADVWARLGIACILVSGAYRAAHRATDLVKTPRR